MSHSNRDDVNGAVEYQGMCISGLHDNQVFAYSHQGVSLPIKHLLPPFKAEG